MHTGHLEQYFKYFLRYYSQHRLKTINLTHFRTLLSVSNLNIFALGGNAHNRIKCKEKSVVMFMLPHYAVNLVAMIMMPRASGGARA